MLSFIGLEKSYHTLIVKVVFSRESKTYMTQQNEDFQGIKRFQQFLYDYFLNPNDPNDLDDGRKDNAEETEGEFK